LIKNTVIFSKITTFTLKVSSQNEKVPIWFRNDGQNKYSK